MKVYIDDKKTYKVVTIDLEGWTYSTENKKLPELIDLLNEYNGNEIHIVGLQSTGPYRLGSLSIVEDGEQEYKFKAIGNTDLNIGTTSNTALSVYAVIRKTDGMITFKGFYKIQQFGIDATSGQISLK